MDKYIVGVTGGIGSGKTAATDVFKTLGIDVVDADLVSRKVVEPGSVVLFQIEQHFGEDILLENGQLNRAKLREIIFRDQDAKQWVNDLMHPAIRQEIVTCLAEAKSDYVVLSAPLLIENGLEKFCNRVLVIDIPEEMQLSRASRRDDVNEEQIRAIMASQIDRQRRLKAANDVIDNSGDLALLSEQVKKYHNKYVSKSKQLG
jgi:dephospho-CoA kinase